METIKKHSKLFISLVSVAVVSVTTAIILNKKSKRKPNGDISSQNSSQISNLGDEQQKAPEKVKPVTNAEVKIMDEPVTATTPNPVASPSSDSLKITVTRSADGHLTKQSLLAIFKILFDRTKAELRTLISTNRRDRRKYLDDINTYIPQYVKLMEAHEALLMNLLEEVCQANGLTSDEYNNTFEHLVNQGHQDLLMMMANMPQLIKQSLPPTKKLSPQEVIEIFEFQNEIAAEVLNELQDDTNPQFQMMFMSMPGLQFDLVMTRVNDKIHAKYEVEEEDLVGSVRDNDLAKDKEVQRLMQEYLQILGPLMPQQEGMGF